MNNKDKIKELEKIGTETTKKIMMRKNEIMDALDRDEKGIR